MNKTILVFIIIFLVSGLAFGQYTERQSGVQIVWDLKLIQFPLSFNDRALLKTKEVDSKQLKSCVGIVLKFLQKYPNSFLKNNLKIINLVGLLYYKTSYQGFFTDKNLYVVYDSNQKGTDYRNFESSLHYYFSHLMLEQYKEKLDLKAWHELNPEGFAYEKDHHAIYELPKVPMIQTSKPYSPEFLYETSAHSLEEDFAGIAKNLLLADQYFWKIVQENPKLMKKTQIVIEFFKKLDPEFNKAYFQNVSSY